MIEGNMFTKLISLSEAKGEGLVHYYTGLPCKREHLTFRLVSTRQCLGCNAFHSKKFRDTTKQSFGNALTYFDSEPCKYGHIGERYTAGKQCLTCHKEAGKLYRKHNKQKINDNVKRFKKKHPDRVNADTAKRRASKQNATPSWITVEMLNEIKVFYKQAKQLEKETGIMHHVDHIIPLNGKDVSGLHVPWNLRVITSVENLSKSNKLLESFV